MKKLAFCFICLSFSSVGQLKLPFFDDFSEAKNGKPDPRLWQSSSAYINNDLVANPPTINVATFDGIAENGKPYNFDNKYAYGTTDTLVSKAIDLSNIISKSSTILSFEVLAKGLGERPDLEDSLTIEFFDKNQEWVRVEVGYMGADNKWKTSGSIKNEISSLDTAKVYFFEQKFRKIFVSLVQKNDSIRFFHSDFKFRILGTGKQSGAFDMWHIDYVFLDQNRKTSSLNEINDFAVQGKINRLLKNYYTMPLSHLLVNQTNEWIDSLKIQVVNRGLTNRGLSGQVQFFVKNAGNNETLWTRSYLPSLNYSPFETRTEKVKIEGLGIGIDTKKLEYGFKMQAADDSTFAIVTKNNAESNTLELGDFFSYDDGTAEYGAEVLKKYGRAGVLYHFRKKDYLGAVRICFVPYIKNLAGQAFLLQIMGAKTDAKTGDLIPSGMLLQQIDTIRYANQINGFVEYKLRDTLEIEKDFFITFTKLEDDNVPIGIDKNTPDFHQKIYYTNGTEWVKNTDLKAALMIRPVVTPQSKGGTKILAVNNILKAEVYPNPTTGMVEIKHPNLIREISLFNARGLMVLNQKDVNTNHTNLNLETVPSGTYYLVFETENGLMMRQKIVKF